jgi:RimJ/RimL family protein N-acetyltransferase
MTIDVTSPFPFEALPRVWKWIEPFRSKVSDDFAPQSLTAFIQYMSLKWERQKTWAVYGDGELGGLIVFERINPWLGTASIVLKPDFQGQGIAVKACRIAVAQMFEQVGIGKVDFYLLAGNYAIGSLLITLGAKREGTLESHTLRNGKPTDLWVYGLTKASFEVKQNGISIGHLRTHNADQHVGRDQPVDRNDQRHVEQHPHPIAGVAAAHGATVGVLVAVDERPDRGAGTHP